MTDEQRAAIIGFLHALIPFLVLINIIDWSKEAIAASIVVVSTGVTMVSLFFAKKRAAVATDPPPNP